MQAVTPVDVHIENEWHKKLDPRKTIKISIHRDRQTPRMPTRTINKIKTKKTRASVLVPTHVPKQAVIPKLVSKVRSPSSSPNRGPW